MADIRALLRRLGRASAEQRAKVLARLSPSDIRALAEEWSAAALPGQIEPKGAWRTWLIRAGRGFGKTRTGAEWVLERARRVPGARIALVGASIDDAARVMVEGESGILACRRTGESVEWVRTKSELKFASGAVGHLYSGASPDGLRGPQHHFAWADEIAKWLRPVEAWAMLEMGLRLGEHPQALVTTTPSKLPLLEEIAGAAGTVVTRGRTFDNPHLPAAFVEAMRATYEGTRLGRQELHGEVASEAEGALWTRDTIEACRCEPPAEASVQRVVIGVDPPAGPSTATGARRGGDMCGIVVCARLRDGRGVVLADCSVGGERPDGWARAVAAAAAAWGADRVVAESNNGGQMVASVLRMAAPGLPLRLVHAMRGKGARAEPVAAAFEARKCLFAGRFAELEDELTALTAGGFTGGGSPDRADAMVWALTELVVKARPEPRVRSL